jgi:hypothetical protein
MLTLNAPAMQRIAGTLAELELDDLPPPSPAIARLVWALDSSRRQNA